ncbi:MAG: OB-fold nucleic acid binding domain-containing protein [Propionibacteriaceae bacterium]|jgi:RecG-like helicase|nr:OB-fold nucleic acid binding domain-containing protein [Propionibacteriaceae bacterium]
MSLASRLRARLTRVFSSNDDLVAQEMAATTTHVGAQTIASIKARQVVHLYGEVHSVTINPSGSLAGFQADFYDGTGHLTLAWLGRSHVPGIVVGSTMRVTGRVTRQGSDLVVYNPVYTIEADESE